MKTIKSIFLICCMMLNIYSPVFAATPNFDLTQAVDNDDIEIMAQELASNEDFQDLSAVMFDTLQTFLISLDLNKSLGSKEQRLDEINLMIKNNPSGKNFDNERLSKMLGYDDVQVYLELNNIADNAAKKLSKYLTSIPKDLQEQVVIRAIEIIANETYFSDTVSNKIMNAKNIRSCIQQCQNDLTNCGVPTWKKFLFASCIAAGIGSTAAAGIIINAGTAGTATVAVLVGIASAIDAVGVWCADELGVSNRGCLDTHRSCLEACKQ